MISTFLNNLISYGLVNNVVVSTGAGVVLMQREKTYRSFRYLSCLFLILGIVLCSEIAYALENYVYSKFDIGFIAVTVNVFFVGVFNLLMSKIWKKISSFKVYLYDSSFSYAMDVAFMLAVIFSLDMSLAIVDFAMCVLAICAVVLIMNVFIGFFIESYNRSYIDKNFRNVSSRLFLFAIFAVILYYAGMLAI